VPITNLKAQINSLVQLQKIDSEIYALNEEKRVKPEEIKAIEASFEEKKKNLAALEKTSLDLQKQKKDRELELGSKEESSKKLQSQLYSLKTNKEYQTMLQQIEDSKADASIIEDKILECLEKMDKAKADVDQENKKLQEEEKVFNAQKGQVDTRIKEIDVRLGQLDAERKIITPEIDPKVLAQYERILASREGLAIVGADNNSCHGCNMFVPPQVTNLIKMYERLITCEICNRILYIHDERD